MNGSGRTFEFPGNGLGVPAAWSQDKTKHPQQPAEPFALTSPSFRVCSLLCHRPVASRRLEIRGAENVTGGVATPGSPQATILEMMAFYAVIFPIFTLNDPQLSECFYRLHEIPGNQVSWRRPVDDPLEIPINLLPAATSFRTWMNHLISPRGNEPEWPWLLREMMIAEYSRQRALNYSYASEVFKNRDADDPTTATVAEKRKVRDLYHFCLKNHTGCFTISDTRYWLLGYEWPNQGRDRGRRADLVGLSADGGLVVFECKLMNSYGPFAAALEGLDYLACLTSTPNFEKIRDGFSKWRAIPTRVVPAGFESVQPDPARQHHVVVLTTNDYFKLYSQRSGRGGGWGEFVRLPEARLADPVTIRFAVTDFNTEKGIWVSS